MKVVLLAGGFGTRLSEETDLRPKPMIEIGGLPILLHIMKIFAAYGHKEFIICLGYKGYYIKEYFANYELHRSDVTYDFKTGKVEFFNRVTEDWRVTLVDTGLHTMTGGRLKRVHDLLGDQTFLMTYGDGVADIDINALIACHRQHGKSATVTAVQPPGRFGAIELGPDHVVKAFREKPKDEVGWINGGFFVLEPSVIDTIDGDSTTWETTPLERLAARGELVAHLHSGFWQPVDTLRDKRVLEELWATGSAPWRIWP